jgi:hypothetical protein
MNIRILILIMLFPVFAHAGSLTLHHPSPQTLVWEASEGADGYRVYVQTVKGVVKQDVGNVTQIKVPTGLTVYVTAYAKVGESGPSNALDLRGVRVKPSGTVTLRKPTATQGLIR